MARPSMPADPVDDRLANLQDCLAQVKEEMKALKESHQEELKTAQKTITEQKEQIVRWTLEKRNLLSELEFINVHVDFQPAHLTYQS